MKLIGIIITGILTSMYLFPFEFVGLPGFNTKRILAVFGLVTLIIELSKGHRATIDKNIFILSLFALAVSFMSLLSTTLNGITDNTYVGYIASMWVWMSAAYFVIKIMQRVHGRLSVWIICNYLISVCVGQCIVAILIDRFAPVKNFVDTYFELDQKFLDNTPGVKRKYGIGASVDVAGTRFASVMAILSVIISKAQRDDKSNWLYFYVIAFFIIGLMGNIISRTTTVGIGLAFCYWLSLIGKVKINGQNLHRKAISLFILVSVVVVCSAVYLYNTDKSAHDDLRFGFEGFFSLFERGTWDVSSNDRLMDMYVFPDNLKTWIIGDGYFENPRHTDPYFIGEMTGGYYMGTDVGYLRFIFYFGLLGLITFSAFIIKAASICADSFKSYRAMFYLLAVVNFIVWFKVATDIFIIFAPFLCLSALNDNQDIDMCDMYESDILYSNKEIVRS